LILFLFFSINLNASVKPAPTPKKVSSGVINKMNIRLDTENGRITSQDMEGKFTFLWFYDTNCPHCISSMSAMNEVVNHVTDNYSDDINIVFVSVAPRDFQSLYHYLDQYGFAESVISAKVGDYKMNEYMNVEATPTFIMVDPYLSIVDKIEGIVLPGIYTRHIDQIMKKFYESHQ
jgi:cytochrome oxidase Cu insertion factor (SCO1/SenC/PrrC family)